MVNIALTFDYELFFGENFGSYDEILFNPTTQLMDLLDKYNTKATFFVDVLSVYMQEKYGNKDYCINFIEQIQDMVLRGHDVQLHIHSNWLKSKFVDGKWNFDVNSYAIHSFGFDENEELSVQKIIKWGKTYLENVLKQVEPKYRCIAYRAGGYMIQPHQNLFSILKDNDIIIDSSIALRQKAVGLLSYDYSNLGKQNSWWISKKLPLERCVSNIEGTIYEVPVGYIKSSLIRRLLRPSFEKVLRLSERRGSYIGTNLNKENDVNDSWLVVKLKRLFSYTATYRLLSFDSVHYKLMISQIRKLYKKDKSITVAAIGHPKLIDSVWLENFEGLLIELKKTDYCNTVSMMDIWQSIKI